MTPELPNINVSDPQGAIDSVVAPEPQIAPPAFKSRFEGIIKQYEQMLAKSQEEDQKASGMLNDLMRPDSFRDKYLPKPTARGILADALYNFGMSYQSSRTGQQFRPIEQQRLEQAMDQYRLDVQNKRVDVENRRNTMQNMLGQMQQLRLAQSNEEQQFQAQERQRLAEETEARRKRMNELDNEYNQALLHSVTIPKTASEIERNAAIIRREKALEERMKLAKNPWELFQMMQLNPLYQSEGFKDAINTDIQKIMKSYRAGQQQGMGAWGFRPIGAPGFIPGVGQVASVIDRDGNVSQIPTGTLPVSQVDELRMWEKQMATADGALTSLSEAVANDYVKEMSGVFKSAGPGIFSFETARRMGLYGKFNSIIEGSLDQFFERLRTGAVAEESGKAFTQGEISEVQKWQPDKKIDQAEDYALKGFKIALWEKLSKRKMLDNPMGFTERTRGVGFAGLINKYAKQIMADMEKMGKASTPETRRAKMLAWEERIYSEAQRSDRLPSVAPPSATPLPAPRPRVEKVAETPTPKPTRLAPKWRYNMLTGKPEPAQGN